MTQQKQGRSNQRGFPPAGINHCNYKSNKLLQGSNGSENSKQQWQIIKEKRSGLRPSFTFKKFQGLIAKPLFSFFFSPSLSRVSQNSDLKKGKCRTKMTYKVPSAEWGSNQEGEDVVPA